MDQQTNYEVDRQLLDELLRNGRIIQHPTYGEVKLQRPTAKKERLIAEKRQRQHHTDLQARMPDNTPAVLSRAQLEKMGIERGVWSEEDNQRLAVLKTDIAKLMVALEGSGFVSEADTLLEYQLEVNKLIDLYPADDNEAVEAILRFFDLDAEGDPADMKIIRDRAITTEADDMIEELMTRRSQMYHHGRLQQFQVELQELTARYVRLTQDSIESRYERAEVLAQIFYCATRPDGTTLWASFDDIEDANAYDIEVLREELYFFWSGYHKDLVGMLRKNRFTVRVPETTSEVSSDASPGHPESNSDGGSQESKP
jgi:hypothetical protein